MRLSEWAAAHFYLSSESSYVEGRWVAYPFQPAIMDAMSNDGIEEVCVTKSARIGYTKMICAAMGYFAHHKRRNQAIWQPTDADAEDFVKTEIDTMLRDVSVMDEVFPQASARDKRNTLQQKQFLGSVLHVRGGKAAKNYRRLTVDVAILDELDGFDLDIEKEGSPVLLSDKRTEGATFPKRIRGSTPKLRGLSMIEAAAQAADQFFRFHIPCIHCSEWHVLSWGGKSLPHGMKWQSGEPDTVVHLCPHCGGLATQADYLSVWQRGRWISASGVWIDPEGRFISADGVAIPPPRSVAFHVWTAYSPQATWSQIVREFMAASTKAETGDKSPLKTFVNTTLGESWEEEVEKTDDAELRKRAEPYPLGTVPAGGLVLFAGVDVQSGRFEVVVWAFGRGEEMWVVDYRVIEANPADEREWVKLESWLCGRWRHAGGQSMALEAAAVDTGGHYTHQAYAFARKWKNWVYPIKGDTAQGRPVSSRSSLQEVRHNGKVIKNGIRLWFVGTDTAKDLLHGRLGVAQPGPGYVHFSTDLPDEFYRQLTAEYRVQSANGDYRWVKLRPRNEVLDCTVYAMFCAHRLGINKWRDRDWERLEGIYTPVMDDLFAQAAPAAPTPLPAVSPKPPRAAQRRTGGGFGSESWTGRL